MNRPILLGMCNPYSDDPALALWPNPPGCSGWRLWKMVDDACKMSKDEYVRSFDRRNLLPSREWDARAARAAGRDFLAINQGRDVVVLGQEVWRALGLGAAPAPRTWHSAERCAYLIHPSGRSRHYNDAMNRWWAGKMLADLVRGDVRCAG